MNRFCTETIMKHYTNYVLIFFLLFIHQFRLSCIERYTIFEDCCRLCRESHCNNSYNSSWYETFVTSSKSLTFCNKSHVTEMLHFCKSPLHLCWLLFKYFESSCMLAFHSSNINNCYNLAIQTNMVEHFMKIKIKKFLHHVARRTI